MPDVRLLHVCLIMLALSWKVLASESAVRSGSSVLVFQVFQSVVVVAVHVYMDVFQVLAPSQDWHRFGSSHQLLVHSERWMVARFLPIFKVGKQQKSVRRWLCSCISWSVLSTSQNVPMNVVSQLCYG